MTASFTHTLTFLAAVAIAGCAPLQGPSATENGVLRVATWNLEHLAESNGVGCRPRQDADYAELRRHADALNADVVALQEVESKAAAERVFDPAKYDVIMSGRPQSRRGGTCYDAPGQSIRHQGVAFAIRKGIRWVRNPDLSDLALTNPDLRWGVDVTVTGPNPVRFLAVHLKSGCNSGRSPTDSDCPVLFGQLPVLERWIDARAHAREPYAILGDWNRRLAANGDQFFGALDRVQRPDTDLELADSGRAATCKARYREFIDHIVTGPEVTARIVPGSFAEYTYGLPEARHPSDHCPVSVLVKL